MLGYLARRLAMTVPTLLLVGVTVFVMMRLVPGDPVLVMLGDAAGEAEIADMRAALGLDRKLPVQFALWLSRVAVGDLGASITNGQPVLGLILDRFQVSAAIVLVAVAVAALIAVPLGLLAAWKQNSTADLAIVTGATVLVSVPSFWLGLLLLLLFGLRLGWLPVVGFVRPGFTLRIQDAEVAEVFEVPLSFLMNPLNHQRHRATWRGREREYYAMPYNGHYIWGATAGMLKNMYDRIFAAQ